MIEDIIVPLGATALAELGDKSQLCILLLASKTKDHIRLLAGIMAAFFIVDGIAVFAGTLLLEMIPKNTLGILTGSIFIAFGILALAKKENNGDELKTCEKPFMTGFTFIGLSELGDKTQIATGLFATRYNASSVFLGVMIALLALSTASVYIGKRLSGKIDPTRISRVSGIVFLVIGVYFIYTL